MKKLWRLAAIALVAFLIPACGGASFGCKRNADGSIECNVTTHGDGKHDH